MDTNTDWLGLGDIGVLCIRHEASAFTMIGLLMTISKGAPRGSPVDENLETGSQ
jgi:hypothetical protein